MLILERGPMESILIGDDIVVTILAVHGKSVKVGIAAPKSIKVHRQEVHERIKEQEKQR